MFEGFTDALRQALTEALAGGRAHDALKIADTLAGEGHFGDARAVLESAWEALPSEPRIAVRLLELHTRYHNWQAFDALAREALQRHPDSGELHFVVGCGNELRGEWERAARAFARAGAQSPLESEPVLRRARVLRVSGRVQEAIDDLRAAIKRQPGVAPLHAALGYALIDSGTADKAVQAFRKAHRIQPDWAPYLDDLAGALMLCEKWKEAIRTAAKSLERRKKNERAWTVYAVCHQNLGDEARADQGYRNALRSARDPTRAKGNYGLFLRAQPERLLEAVRYLRDAHDAHPQWREVAEALEELTTT